MRVLITGLGGFAGRHLAAHLRSVSDWSLWGTVFGADERDAQLLPPERVPVGDLRDPSVVAEIVREARPELVFHLAAQASVAEAWREPWRTLEANVRMTLNFVEAMQGQDGPAPRLLLVSSNEVYGGPAPEALPTSEEAPLAPTNPYATSKLCAELLSDQLCRARGVELVRVRPFNHLGPGQDRRFVAASFAHQVAEMEAGLRQPVLRVGNLEAERDFSDVRDIVRGYRLAAERGEPGSVYNLGSGRAWPIDAIVQHLLEHATVPVNVEPDPERMRPSDVPRTLCDASLAHAELGWEPRIPFEQTMVDILADARARVTAQAAEGGRRDASPSASAPSRGST